MTTPELKELFSKLTFKELKVLVKKLGVKPERTKDLVVGQIVDGFEVTTVIGMLGVPINTQSEEEALRMAREGLKKQNWEVVIAVLGLLIAGWPVYVYYYPNTPPATEVTESISKIGSLNIEQEEVSIFIDTNAYHILLLPFGSSQNCKSEAVICEREVQARFNWMQDQDTSLNIEVQLYYGVNNTIESLSFNRAKLVGDSLGADLVIWGDYKSKCTWDSTKVRLKWVTVDEESFFLDEKKSVEYKSVDEISKIEEGEITGDVEDIVYWGLGLEAESKNNFEKAIFHYEKIQVKQKVDYAEVYFRIALCLTLKFGKTNCCAFHSQEGEVKSRVMQFIKKGIQLDSQRICTIKYLEFFIMEGRNHQNRLKEKPKHVN